MNDAAPIADDYSPERKVELFLERWREGLRTSVPSKPGDLITNPYQGLRSFQPETSWFFCGREAQKKDLKEFFASAWTNEGNSRRLTFVVGGSGSGKSSLVRAGLVAELDRLQIKGKPGAWYVVEMRPAKDPAGQLRSALVDMLMKFADQAFSASSFEVRDAIIKAAYECGIIWPDGDRNKVEAAFENWVDAEIFTGRSAISTSGVFDLVKSVISKLEYAACSGVRSGPPLVLLYIDQFEEIFHKECDAVGRNALIDLLRDIHDYPPERLFAVATMRSEEIHRFSEYPGMAGVINSSMYLVDLVAGDDVEEAIVKPALRLARLWDLPLHSPRETDIIPYTPTSFSLLKGEYDLAGKLAGHMADQLPLLQHFLPLAWARAVDDWIERRAMDSGALFEIDARHLEKVSGWTGAEKESRLARCLNKAAGEVCTRATAELVRRSTSEQSMPAAAEEAKGVLMVALCSLAQLDDAGRAVRKFVTPQDMWMASAGAKRLGLSSADIAEALKKFEEAGLVERLHASKPGEEDHYNVTHESLIRNWSEYKRWLEEKRRVENCLKEVSTKVSKLRSRKRYRFKWLDQTWKSLGLRPWRDIDRALEANRAMPPGSDVILGKLFQPESIYSLQWAGKVLQVDQSFMNQIREAWEDSNWYQSVGKRAQADTRRRLVYGGVLTSVVAALAILLLMRAEVRRQGQELALQVYDVTTPKEGRSAVHDRMLVWVMESVLDQYTKSDHEWMRWAIPDHISLLRETVSNLDAGVRKAYGEDIAILIASQIPNGERPELDSGKKAVCTRAKPRLKFKMDSNIVQGFETATSDKPAWNQGFVADVQDGVICASDDGRWLLILDSPKKFVEIRRLNPFVSTGFTLPGWQRTPVSRENQARMGWLTAQGFFDKILTELPSVYFHHEEGIVGFRIGPPPEKSSDWADDDVLFWTTTGLSDPDETMDAPPKWETNSDCVVQPIVASSDEPEHFCAAEHFLLDADYKNIIVRRDRAAGDRCQENYDADALASARPCNNNIEIQYDDDVPTTETEFRAKLTDQGAKIIKAQIQNDWLWLEDEKGKLRRYLVGKRLMNEIMKLRWLGTTWVGPRSPYGIEYRIPKSCDRVEECRQYIENLDDVWPGQPNLAAGGVAK